MTDSPISLYELNRRITNAIAVALSLIHISEPTRL